MNNLEQQINTLKGLQQSYDSLSDNYDTLNENVSAITGSITNLQGPNSGVTLTTLHNDLQRPSYETVNIYLTASGASWTEKQVVVHDLSTEQHTGYNISENGQCSFNVPNGDSYQISLPSLPSFVSPETFSFVSINYSRTINYTYTIDERKETAHIVILNGLSKQQINVLDGQTLVAYDENGVGYSGLTVGSSCNILIPYGKTYTITPPIVSGYRKETSSITYTAYQVQRSISIFYTEDQYGMFGVDENGTLYTIEECQALQDKSIIKYGFYNDADLANSTRVTDGYGNGFYWKFGAESAGSLQWATSNTDFDTIRLPYYSNLGGWKYAGRYMTDKIIEIGLEVLPSVTNPTPAATACANRSETFGGKTHRGILLSYDQIYKIATTNRTLFQSLYTAIGRTAPTIWSGGWWSSCQNSATNGVYLGNGGFHTNLKNTSFSVFVAFDL